MKLERQEKCVFCDRIIHFGEKAFVGFESGFVCCDQCKDNDFEDDFFPIKWNENERYYFTPDESNAFLVTYKGVNNGNEYFGSKYYTVFDRLTIELDKDYKLKLTKGDRAMEDDQMRFRFFAEEKPEKKEQPELTAKMEYNFPDDAVQPKKKAGRRAEKSTDFVNKEGVETVIKIVYISRELNERLYAYHKNGFWTFNKLAVELIEEWVKKMERKYPELKKNNNNQSKEN